MIDSDQFNNYLLISQIAKGNYNFIENRLNKKEINFESFREFLRNNRITSYVYPFLREHELIDLFPIKFKQEIEKYYLRQENKNNSLICEIVGLNNSFVQNNVEVIFLKGLTFTLNYYRDLGRRSISDIDILVENYNFVDPVIDVLESKSYRMKSKPIFGKKLSTYFTHHYEYQRNKYKLDLHWVLQSHYTYKLNYGKIWSTKRVFNIKDSNYIYTLSDEYELVFRVLSIFIDIQLGTIRIKSFIDLYEILKKDHNDIDWNEFFDARKNEGINKITINIIDILLCIFDCYEEFPILYKIIQSKSDNLIYKDKDCKFDLLSVSHFSFKNKYYTFRLYDSHLILAILWWLVSLPVRISIYQGVFLKPFKRYFK